MRDLNPRIDIPHRDNDLAGPVPAEFDPTSVFADPVAYLDLFGLRSELVENRTPSLPAAA